MKNSELRAIRLEDLDDQRPGILSDMYPFMASLYHQRMLSHLFNKKRCGGAAYPGKISREFERDSEEWAYAGGEFQTMNRPADGRPYSWSLPTDKGDLVRLFQIGRAQCNNHEGSHSAEGLPAYAPEGRLAPDGIMCMYHVARDAANEVLAQRNLPFLVF